VLTYNLEREEFSGDLPTRESDLFDVGVENEIKKHRNQNGALRGGKSSELGRNTKRQKKNEKYGFGGKKRNAKSGDAVSSGDLSGFSSRKMKGGKGSSSKAQRPGKGRRKAMASKY
jgi:rRNA-processing protein EBP2